MRKGGDGGDEWLSSSALQEKMLLLSYLAAAPFTIKRYGYVSACKNRLCSIYQKYIDHQRSFCVQSDLLI